MTESRRGVGAGEGEGDTRSQPHGDRAAEGTGRHARDQEVVVVGEGLGGKRTAMGTDGAHIPLSSAIHQW